MNEKDFESLLGTLQDMNSRLESIEKAVNVGNGGSPATKRKLSSETIVSLYNEGVKVKEIAERAGVGTPAIYAILKQYK